MNLINEAARAAVRKEYPLPALDLQCLAAQRTVVEHAVPALAGRYYTDLVTTQAFPHPPGFRYAADAEASFRARGYVATDAPRPGDIPFGNIPDPEGHTGVIYAANDGTLWVLENTAYERGVVLYGNVRMTPLDHWDKITTLGRLPAAMVERPDPLTPPPKVTAKVRRAGNGQLICETTIRRADGTPGEPGQTVWVPDGYLR